MRRNVIIATAALGALVVAGCSSGGSSSSSSGTATKSCVATIGMEGPLTGPVAFLGQEQLHFAQLALAKDNLVNHTKISLVQGDTQLNPAQATTVTQQVTSNSKILAVDGPAGSQQVAANAQQFGRNLAQQHKKALIFGTDGLYDPKSFTISGSYVSTFGPDITGIPADAAIAAAAKAKYGSFGTFGPPVFAATHVVD